MSEKNKLRFAGCWYSEVAQDVLSPDGTSAGLRRQSVDVFKYLAEHSNRLVSREELTDNIWQNVAVTDDSLTKCISEIRKVLCDDKRQVLKTLPRRGYQLIADMPAPDYVEENTENSRAAPFFWWLAPIVLLVIIAAYFLPAQRGDQSTTATGFAREDGTPRLAIENRLANDGLTNELRVALSRYRTMQLADFEGADLQLKMQAGSGSNIVLELIHVKDNSVLFAETYDDDDISNANFATRIAATVASPGVGAIGKWQLQSTRRVPVDQLSKAACYAYGYGCSKCSGEEDTITRRAEACLVMLLEEDPNDAQAWALQSTIYAHQYWWANTLPEPARSNPALRKHLPQQAIAAANKAESLSDGLDTSVYWGMAEAYFSACEADKLQTVVNRGLEINPDDPNLMGAFGNWLAYTGKWEEGAALTLKALELEPKRYKKWWWMGPAKSAYMRENFESAYEYFLKAFNERNWMSHLQLAYTLPHLGRTDEARESVATLQYMYPGFTLEKALEIYDLFCFPDSFLQNIKVALTEAGLPSRGSSDDLSNITLPRANVIEVNGTTLEYLDVGSGEPVIFVHGAFNDYRSWGHYMVPVSESHRYISYSRRYFGTQDWADDGDHFWVEYFANDLIGLIEALGLQSAHVVSWSSSMSTVNEAAVRRPDLIKSIVHFEPVAARVFSDMEMSENLKSLEKDWFGRWGSYFENLAAGDEEKALEDIFEAVFEMESGGYDNEREIIREVTRQNARTLTVSNFGKDPIVINCEYLSKVTTPTLVLHGETTHGYWQQMAKRVAECQQDARLAMITGANHYAPLQEIDQVTEAVLSFVDLHR